MKLRRALGFVLGGAAIAALAAACVIDLDPPIDPTDGGLPVDQQVVDSAAPDADASDATRDGGGIECVQNSDCRSEPGAGAGCVTTTCDVKIGRCVYEYCPVPNAVPGGPECKAQVCDFEAGTCGDERPVSFVANELTFATESPMTNLPCAVGTGLSRCFAAAYPFLYVAHTLTTSPLFAFAYPVADIAVTSPQPIPIEGIDFPPAIIVRSGPLVYFIGRVQALTSTSGLLPIAWLEAPRDPRAVTMKATKITAQYGASPSIVPNAFPVPGGAVLLTSTTSSVLLEAPLIDKGLVLPIAPQVGTPQGGPVAQSGDRMVLVNQPASGNANGQLVRNAGTTAGNALTAQSITVAISRSVPGQSVFAYTTEGTVVSLTAPWNGDASTPIDSVRFTNVIGPNLAFADSGAAGTTLVSYEGGIPIATKATGPLAPLDPSRTVAFALEPPSATFAQLVEVDDAGAFRPLDPNRHEVFDGGPGTFSTQTSSGWVYLLQASGLSVSVRVLQPSCDVP